MENERIPTPQVLPGHLLDALDFETITRNEKVAMKGDRAKPESGFSRWVEYFLDGWFYVTRKGKKKIPSPCSKGKRWNRRFLRRIGKKQEKT